VSRLETTPRHLLREHQSQDSDLFRLLVDQVQDYAIFLLTTDGHIASWNAGAERLKGYVASEIVGQSFERFYTPEDRAAGRPQHLLGIARTAGRVEDEGWRVRKDGTRFWADVVITALRNDSGQLVGFAKVTRDLSERRAVEAQLYQSDARFRTLVESIKDYAIFLLAPNGTVLSWNVGAARLKGYTEAEIVGSSFERFYTPEDRAAGRPARLLAAALAEGRVEDEGWRVRKDGTRFWADVVITALVDEGGRLIGYAKVTRDLTERRQAEMDRATRLAVERAADRARRLQLATAALSAVSRPEEAAEVLTDEGLKAVGAAAGVLAFPTSDGEALEVVHARGYEPDELGARQIFNSNAPNPIAQAWRTAEPLFVPSREDAPEVMASSRHAAWAVVPMLLGQRVVGVLGLSFDEPRALDEEERGFLLALCEVGAQALDRAAVYDAERRAHAEAQAAVHAQDEFLSIASHELRTPVAAVKATAQLAQRAIQRGQFDAARTMRHLETIARATDRLTALVEDLLDVSRLRTGQLQLRPEVLDLRPLVEETVARYRATEPRHDFRLALTDSPAIVTADPLRVEQVLDNMLSNAVKYTPAGGQIEVRLAAESDGVTLTVKDDGIGLPPGQETRIFEAFGRAPNAAIHQIPGLGLGLSICRELIESHGGRIWASSPGEDQGTTIGVWLASAADRPG
jgi:PAS domain S-box-containing protein